MESQQLLTQGQVFQDKVLPGAKDRKYPAEQMYQTPKHDRILAECAPWTQAPKSLILRMYGVLANHSVNAHIVPFSPIESHLPYNPSFGRSRFVANKSTSGCTNSPYFGINLGVLRGFVAKPLVCL